MNFVITGAVGTGKTAVAQAMAIFFRLKGVPTIEIDETVNVNNPSFIDKAIATKGKMDTHLVAVSYDNGRYNRDAFDCEVHCKRLSV